jgi:hypothetical protein
MIDDFYPITPSWRNGIKNEINERAGRPCL